MNNIDVFTQIQRISIDGNDNVQIIGGTVTSQVSNM